MIVIGLSKGKAAIIDKIDSNNIKWYLGANGYAQHKSRGEKGIYLHRWVMARKLKRDLLPTEYVDHKNGDTLDNRRCNLRLCTMSQNLANAKVRSNNTTGAKGVSLDKRNGHYTAHYYINSKKHHIGSYKTLKEAAAARRKKELELYGDFAYRERVQPRNNMLK